MSFINGTVAQFQGSAAPVQANAVSNAAVDGSTISYSGTSWAASNAAVTSAGTATRTDGDIYVTVAETTWANAAGGSNTLLRVGGYMNANAVTVGGTLDLIIDVTGDIPSMDTDFGSHPMIAAVDGATNAGVINLTRNSATQLRLVWQSNAVATAAAISFSEVAVMYTTSA